MLVEMITCGRCRSSMISCGHQADFLFSGILIHVWMSLAYVVGREKNGLFHEGCCGVKG